MDGRAYRSYTASLNSPLKWALSMFESFSCIFVLICMKKSCGEQVDVIVEPKNLCGCVITELTRTGVVVFPDVLFK